MSEFTMLHRVVIFYVVLLLIVSYSVVIYGLVQATAFNVILAAVFHLKIDPWQRVIPPTA